jgi:hypothetical protein
MRRGRHSPTDYGTDDLAAQQQAESASSVGSTGTRTGAQATGMGTEPTAGSTVPAARGYERGTAPSAAYEREVAGVPRADYMTGGVFAILAGVLTFLAGLAAIARASFYPTLSGYAYAWPIRNWGIVLLVLGVVLFAAGACVLLGMSWARPAGAIVAALTAVAGFLFLAYAPIWGIIIVGVSLIAIWALLHQGAHRAAV